MASFTLSNAPWADGTTVGVYPAVAVPAGFDAPTGQPLTTAVVSGGSVTFTGLTERVRYVAYGAGVARRIMVPLVSPRENDRRRIEELEVSIAVLDEAPINVTYPEFGGTGFSSGDDWTDPFTAASEKAAVAGGKVYIPRGEYRVQDVPWYEATHWEGDGEGATILQPLAPTDPTPMFPAQRTSAVEASERFTHGGFSKMEFDGLDENAVGVGVSTADLQDVAAANAASGLYTWLQHVTFERLYVHDFGDVGIELWGDCRFVPINDVRIWNCDRGMFVAHNHPNFSKLESRFCRIGLDVTALLDCELTACKFNQCDYGLGGPAGRVDRFGQEMGRVDRSRLLGCHFFQPNILGLRLNTQNDVLGAICFGSDVGGSLVEVNGSGNAINGGEYNNFGPDPALAIANGSTGTSVTQRLLIANARFSVTGGGRAIEKTGGTDDLQFFKLVNCDIDLDSVPLDGLGGAAMLIPDALGGFQHFQIGWNTISTSVLQVDHMVKVLASSAPRGYDHSHNTYVSSPAVGTSKAFKVANSTVGGISVYNRYRKINSGADAQDLGITDGTTVSTPNTYV